MEFPAMINNLGEMPEGFPLSWINNNVGVLEKRLEEVERLLSYRVDDRRFNEAIDAIFFIVDKLPLMVMRLNAGASIYRARPNEGKLFSKQTDISYNIAHADKISAGRFNRPLEPLFYAALPVDNSILDPCLHCSLEACKELTHEYLAPTVQDLTVGRWVNNASIPLINLCFDEKHLAGNQDLREAADNFIGQINTFFSKEASDFLYKFMRFFSELASSVNDRENNYYILNAFLYAVRYYYVNYRNTAIPGVIYPSAMTEGLGLNLVMIPQAVDHFLSLDSVFMLRFSLDQATKTYNSDSCSDIARVIDGNFKLENVKSYSRDGKVIDYSS